MEKSYLWEKYLYEIILEQNNNKDKKPFIKANMMLKGLRKGNLDKVYKRIHSQCSELDQNISNLEHNLDCVKFIFINGRFVNNK